MYRAGVDGLRVLSTNLAWAQKPKDSGHEEFLSLSTSGLNGAGAGVRWGDADNALDLGVGDVITIRVVESAEVTEPSVHKSLPGAVAEEISNMLDRIKALGDWWSTTDPSA